MSIHPLSAIYGGVVGARNVLYDRRLLPVRRLQGPVVSVGNLSTGGSGKTPFVILLGEWLKRRGIDFDVLSRGYGRKSQGVMLVEPGGLPRDFGDEPLLIARRLQVPVVVGEERYDAGRLAEARFGPRFHLLDDGFQHRGLARHFDIVLVTPDDARDRLLPGGRLRERLTALRRADAIVLTNGAAASDFPVSGKMVWKLRRGIVIENVNIPKRPVVFCGIARPRNFVLQLRTAGIEPAAEAFFRDHHAYTEKDVRDLLQLRARSDADGFVSTEKDAVNLGIYFDAIAPLAAVQVKMELADANNVLDAMLRAIEERGSGRERMPGLR
jgi:tetraacyldisaccharide 4'-kinase